MDRAAWRADRADRRACQHPAWAEPLPVQDPAIRHLWERVATLNDFHNPHLALEATIAALVAAGAITADDAVTGAARAVLAVLRPDGVSPGGVPGDLPGPWHSLLAHWGQTGGPVATIPVGAITPSFDGVTAAVIALESSDEHFGISVELVPASAHRAALPRPARPAAPHLVGSGQPRQLLPRRAGQLGPPRWPVPRRNRVLASSGRPRQQHRPHTHRHDNARSHPRTAAMGRTLATRKAAARYPEVTGAFRGRRDGVKVGRRPPTLTDPPRRGAGRTRRR